MANTEWFSEARFGMMLHWGLYSLLAGEYGDETLADSPEKHADLGEWIQSHCAIPVAEYEKLAKAFYPIGFDAEEYVKLAKEAGMNYIVITSKHHDGFAMFKSEADPYNVVDATPYGRDPLRELADACKKHGLKLGLYYSQELDWHEPDGGGYDKGYRRDDQRSSWTNNWDFPDNAKKDFSRCLEKKIKPQIREILTNYGEIALIWFDTPGVITPEQSQELHDLVKSLQPDCMVNSRIGNGKGDYTSLGDNQIPSAKKDRGMLYETAATLNGTWGYKSHDQNWKDVRSVLSLLTRLAGRNVNYLLNIGPDHLGRIPVPAQRILRSVGEWIKVNGEAIYGTDPSPYSMDLPSGPVTAKGDHLYFVLNQPEKELKVSGLLSDVEAVCLLGGEELPFSQEGSMLTVQLPELSDKLFPVVRLSAKGGVCVEGGIVEMPDHSFTLTPLNAAIQGDIVIGDAGDMEKWVNESASLSWTFRSSEEGEYAAELTVNGLFGTAPLEALISLSVNDVCVERQLAHDRDIDPLLARHHKGMISHAGSVRLVKGENRISLRLAVPAARDMFRFASMKLTRV